MSDQPTIVTNADGSINTAYYLARGRKIRSDVAHRQVKAVANARRSALSAAGVWFSAKIGFSAKHVTT